MKLLIAYLLAATISLMADTVRFRWNANTESDLKEYVFQIGTSLADGEIFYVPKQYTGVIVDMQPHQRAWVRASTESWGWSEPAGPLEYRPVVVELVVQSTRIGPTIPWTVSELFRMDETLFTPEAANIRTHLLITPTRLEVEFLEGPLLPRVFLLNTSSGNEFFRSYVAFRLL